MDNYDLRQIIKTYNPNMVCIYVLDTKTRKRRRSIEFDSRLSKYDKDHGLNIYKPTKKKDETELLDTHFIPVCDIIDVLSTSLYNKMYKNNYPIS